MATSAANDSPRPSQTGLSGATARRSTGQQSILIGRGSVYLFDAVLEIHPTSSGWDDAELVLTCPLLCEKHKIYSRLLQLAALLAGQQGCRSFLVMRDGCDPEVTEMLASMGSVQTGDDTLRVDLAGYADCIAPAVRSGANRFRPSFNPIQEV